MKMVIFDLDGTLVDTIDGLTNAINTVLKEFDFPTHSRNVVKGYVGSGIKKNL